MPSFQKGPRPADADEARGARKSPRTLFASSSVSWRMPRILLTLLLDVGSLRLVVIARAQRLWRLWRLIGLSVGGQAKKKEGAPSTGFSTPPTTRQAKGAARTAMIRRLTRGLGAAWGRWIDGRILWIVNELTRRVEDA